jgi:hypothetical protein
VRARLTATGALAVLGALLCAGPAAAASTQAAALVATTPEPPGGMVVLLGTGGLRWDDIGDLAALSALLDDASGQLAVRSVRATTCPVDGWLAVSSGRRAADDGGTCRPMRLSVAQPGGSAAVPDWSRYVAAADDESFDARPGLLGDTLAAARRSAVAVGPGAAIALAGGNGTVTRAFTGPVDDDRGTVDPTRLADDVQAALALKPDVLAVDLGVVRDPAQAGTGDPRPTGAYAAARETQVQRLDSRLGLVLGQLPADATVVVASLADAGDESQLRLVAARGPAPVANDGLRDFENALLVSSSTRQDGIVQTTDLAPTLLHATGAPAPDGFVGAPLRPVRAGDVVDRLQRLSDLDEAATKVHPIVPWFFNGIVVAQVLLYGLAALVLRLDGGRDGGAITPRRRRTLVSVRRVAVAFATVPAATYLANLLPWWRSDLSGLTVTGAVLLFALPMAVLALTGPWRNRILGPAGVVGGLTALVLAADVATGSHLMLSSLMGVQPVIAGRWYGFSNPGFALFATGCLLLALALADLFLERGDRRRAVVAIGVVGLVATVVDGAPGLGSDFGGPPAIVPAFSVLALLVAGVAITWRRALLIVVATVGVLALLSVADWLRPADSRTHLGAFVQTLLDGDAWPIVERKLAQNLQILFGSWLSALLPVAAAFVVFVLWRPGRLGVRPLEVAYQRSPVLRHGMVAFGVMIVVGFALNDSGTVVPAVASTVAIPLLIAASMRAVELADTERLENAVARARRQGPAKTRPRRAPRLS